jgi:hypothetical protein
MIRTMKFMQHIWSLQIHEYDSKVLLAQLKWYDNIKISIVCKSERRCSFKFQLNQGDTKSSQQVPEDLYWWEINKHMDSRSR